MRIKDEILTDIRSNINQAPKQTRPMLEHEYCFIDVLIDIRDVLRWCHEKVELIARDFK